MYSAVFLFVVVIALWGDSAFGCNKRRPPPPPPPPPPPGSPPPPPPPPPIVKVIRQQEQVMSRNNCKRVVINNASDQSLQSGMTLTGASSEEQQRARMRLKNEGFSDQCLNAEEFEYECEFSVFSEIGMTVIYHPTGCGCAFTIQVVKPRPRLPDVANLMSVNAAYSTKVTKFAIVVYDIEADRVEAEIPEFNNMALSAETTAMIEAQVAADPNGDFSSISAGFAGTVKSFPKLPKQLNKNDPANKNYVPAIMFTIQQKYTTGAMFKVPCHLQMHTAPNAYMSQCQPYRTDDAFAYSKRHALNAEAVENDKDVAWFREFYLFPKQESKCGNAGSGVAPKSRYITSFYDDVDCKAEHGYMSFDREFESKFDSSDAVVGGWKWTRDFSETRVVFGVPHSFSSLTAVWCLGYSQINWHSPSAFQSTDTAVKAGICKAQPTGAAASQPEKYKESHASYPVDAGMQCEPAFTQCSQDVTLLGFQNRDPRDFEKRPRSTMLTGPRRLFCSTASQDGAERVVFDTLTFRGVKAGEALAKRNWDDSAHPEPHAIHMVYSDEHDGLVHGRHAPELVHAFNQQRRKRGEEPMIVDPVAAPPHRDNFALNNAAGTVDVKGADGAPAGDHPLRVFPETYSAPLTLDPVQSASEDEPTLYDGTLVTGVPPKFCNSGDIGCECRPDSAAAKCDHPYECNALNFCERPKCPAGGAGCPVHSDGTCDGTLIVEDGMCVYKPTCELGTLGCVCDAANACSQGSCLDGVCIRSVTEVCSQGEPGCGCVESDGSCLNDSSCDGFSGLCLFESCTVGTRGCRCQKEGNPCSDGFVCSGKGSCVEAKCVPGDAGCQCLDNKRCNKKGFKCVELTRDGSQTACVGSDPCGKDQSARCEAECGRGNVASCGKCDYSQPICRDPMVQYCNPQSYLYQIEPCELDGMVPISASSVALSVVAVLATIAALL